MQIPPNKKVGITAGTFDLLHAGHLLMFQEAKKTCDFLIVCLQTDPSLERSFKNKPVETLYERYKRLSSCKYVDHIIPYETEKDFETILKYTDYDFRFLDISYKDKEFTGKDIKPERHFFNSRNHSYSSSELRKRLLNS